MKELLIKISTKLNALSGKFSKDPRTKNYAGFAAACVLAPVILASAQNAKLLGTLATDTQLPIVVEGKTVGSMTLKAGSQVNVIQTLPNDEVLISRGEGTPVKIPKAGLVAEIPMATPLPVPTATPLQTSTPVPTIPLPPVKQQLSPEHERAISNNDPKTLSKLIGDEIASLPIECGETAQAFKVTDENNRGFNLSSLRGHVVVLGFYTLYKKDDHTRNSKTFDQPLALAEEAMSYPEAKSGDLVALVATPEDSKVFAPFLQENGFTSKPIYDPSDNIRRALHLYGRPIVIIDREGRVVFQRRLPEFSVKSSDAFRKALRSVLDKKVDVRPTTEPKNFSASSNRLLYDFEDGFQGWRLTGDCWGDSPANDALYPGLVGGYAGKRFLSSFTGKEVKGTGIAVSPDFVIDRNFLHLLVAGTDFPEDCGVALICDGKAVKQTAGDNNCQLRPICWDITKYAGKTAHLEVYDAAGANPRDYIMLDEVILSDSSIQPESYAKRYDPDDEACINASKKDLPPYYKLLTEGEFHQESTPGTTYYLEMTQPLLWPANSSGPFSYELEEFPDDFAQKINSQNITVTVGNQQFEATPVTSYKSMTQKKLSVTIPAGYAHAIKSASAKFTCTATIQNLRIAKGTATENTKIAPEQESALTHTGEGYVFDGVWFQHYMTDQKLWKYPSETDAAYLLRALRFFQRYFNYTFSHWAGYSSDQTGDMAIFQRQANDCGIAKQLALLLRANKIPAISGQGFWLSNNGDLVRPHVRTLIHLKKAGWLLTDVQFEVHDTYGQFKEGYLKGDKYMQMLEDNSSNYSAHGNFGWRDQAKDWWRSWKIASQPSTK